MDFVESFVTQLRARASDALFGGSPEAKVAAQIADELETLRRAHLQEMIPIATAVRESGYTDVQLRRLKKEGKWSGRRADFPRRPGTVSPQLAAGSTLARRARDRAFVRRAPVVPRRRKGPKRTGCWWYTAGQAPHTFTVHERTPGGVIYERVFDPSIVRRTTSGKLRRGAQVRRSLGHSDRELAIKHAEAEAAKLRAGVAALEGRPTLNGVLTLYLIHRTPQKGAAETRRTISGTRSSGAGCTAIGSSRSSATRSGTRRSDLRSSGAVDARGNPIADDKRKPVGARGVDAPLVFIVAVLNWAIGFKVKGRQLITVNPFGAPAPGVRRTLARPKNLAPMRPIATWDRFLKIRAKADQVLMFARKGDVGAVLVETGPREVHARRRAGASLDGAQLSAGAARPRGDDGAPHHGDLPAMALRLHPRGRRGDEDPLASVQGRGGEDRPAQCRGPRRRRAHSPQARRVWRHLGVPLAAEAHAADHATDRQ
jgi:hypothetical protein